MGKSFINSLQASVVKGNLNCPFGLFLSEQILASKQFGAIPAIRVNMVTSLISNEMLVLSQLNLISN